MNFKNNNYSSQIVHISTTHLSPIFSRNHPILISLNLPLRNIEKAKNKNPRNDELGKKENLSDDIFGFFDLEFLSQHMAFEVQKDERWCKTRIGKREKKME